MSHKQNFPLIKPQIEKVLKQIILKDLSKGRKDFDKPHTEAVVHWMKYLLKNIQSLQPKNSGKNSRKSSTLDPQVLITAAYAHDWGYVGLFSESKANSLDKILKNKKLHMIRGANMIERLLHQRLSRHFTQNQILKVAHLVLFHDKIKNLINEDEILLMEADTLGMLDTNFIKPTFSKKDHNNFMKKGIRGLRLPHFKHPEAKKIALKLIEKGKSFYITPTPLLLGVL
ncbi:hypothetical protein KKD03_05105 [Patescibacteria group bacterium]|nr:hypothetical protein [Patescibacteria group bacterium]